MLARGNVESKLLLTFAPLELISDTVLWSIKNILPLTTCMLSGFSDPKSAGAVVAPSVVLVATLALP